MRPSPCTTCTLCVASRATVFSSEAARAASRSIAHTSPSSPISSAKCVHLPPGAAHRSSRRSCGWGAASRPTRLSLSSCTVHQPSRNAAREPGAWCASTHTRSGEYRAGVAETPSVASRSMSCSRVPRRRLTRSPTGTARLLATISARVASTPKRASHRSTSQTGCEPHTASDAVSSPFGTSIVSFSSARRRSTLFTRPAVPGCPYLCASLTDSSTAACGGMRSRNRIWYAPIRSTFLIQGWTLASPM